MNEFEAWQKRSSAIKWPRRKDAIGDALTVGSGCLGSLLGVALVAAAAGGLLYAVVRIVRMAWGG